MGLLHVANVAYLCRNQQFTKSMADSFYHAATLHNVTQFNVIGVMQFDDISDDFCQIVTKDDTWAARISPFSSLV